MTNRRSSRQCRKASGRRVRVFSEPNHELRPETITQIITSADLEQARREAEARADAEHQDSEEADHA